MASGEKFGLTVDDFLARLNRKGTLSPVSASTRKAYGSSLREFARFLDGRQPTQDLAQEWLQQLLDKGKNPAAVANNGFALRRYFADYLKEKDVVILLPSVESDTIPDYLELEEIDQLLVACRSPMETALVPPFPAHGGSPPAHRRQLDRRYRGPPRSREAGYDAALPEHQTEGDEAEAQADLCRRGGGGGWLK